LLYEPITHQSRVSDEDQPAITHVWWPRFVDTITFLFSKGHCWKVQGTYSALMLCLAQIDPNWFVELQSHRHTPKLLVQSIRNVLLRLSLKVDWRYHQVSSNRNTLIRRRLKAQPLTIKIVRPGGTVVFKKLGGPGGVPQNVVDTTTARFLACSRMSFSTPIST